MSAVSEGPRSVFVAGGRRIQEVAEDYPLRMVRLHGPAVAEGLLFSRFWEGAQIEGEADDGVTLAVVSGSEWPDFLRRRPGWRELPDPKRFLAEFPGLESYL